jgi:hypothetical protein
MHRVRLSIPFLRIARWTVVIEIISSIIVQWTIARGGLIGQSEAEYPHDFGSLLNSGLN